jgi:hypothetical protein
VWRRRERGEKRDEHGNRINTEMISRREAEWSILNGKGKRREQIGERLEKADKD